MTRATGPVNRSPNARGAGGTGEGAPSRVTYASAGVDVAAADEAVQRIKDIVASTARREVLGGIGGFGGCFAFDSGRFERPVLVASTDGVGTKAMVAQALGRYDTIGVDLVAMCVDDLVCVGAEPLFLLDYVVTPKLDPEQMEQLVAGVASGCRRAGCALLGGEMAEHARAMEPGGFDLAGFAVGAVEADRMLGPDRVAAGDVLVGLASPGLRSNGYTLARHVLLERARLPLEGPAYQGAQRSLGEELLLPSVIYAPAVLTALSVGEVHAAAHVTGGGISQNLARVLPPDCDAVVDRSRFETPRIFSEIQRLGDVDDREMERVFNMGIGMLMVVSAGSVNDVVHELETAGVEAAPAGHVAEGSGRASIAR